MSSDRHVVIGMSGHIDHGKTAIIKALTGTNTDRLKEEKERGITTDLGFAFLGNTPEALHVPRKTTPRLKVPIGSVAIAERQTAVYPSVTPGGWQILGRTPIALVNWASDSLALINAGDSVRFEPMTKEEFLAQGGNLDGF